jgi:hypothetical protein
MTRTVNANSVKIVAEDSKEGILLSVSQDGKLATNKIDNQGNVDNQASALTSNFISLTDTPEAFQAEKYLKVNAQGNALEFSDISISTNFISLTDTPNAFKAGSYLRVNTTGDAIEQIKTAPPDGGVGDHGSIQATSNFDGKLPDKLIVKHYEVGDGTSDSYGGYIVCELRQVSQNKILYADTWGDGAYRIVFNNNATGDGWSKGGTNSAPHILSPIDGVTEPSIRQLIDNGYGVFHGQKSGTSGAGSLSAIKSASNFYTDLPDSIVHEHNTGVQFMLNLAHVEPAYICYRYEDHGDSASHDRRVYFNNDSDGTPDSAFTIFFTAAGSLRHYIENGRALYHGHTDNTGSAGTHPEIQAASNFEGVIPDGVIMKRSLAGAVYNYQFNYISSDKIYFVHWTDASGSSSYYARCNNDATGSGFTTLGPNASQYVTPAGETTLQQLIDNGNVVYHGGRSIDSGGGASSVEQLTDVDVTTTPPSAGQVLVYDDTDSKWKPGAQSTDFTDLTDTPSSLDAGSYLRVNTAGDAIEQIKTAPPDGGIGDNSAIQAVSNFDGKLPDTIIGATENDTPVTMHLYHVSSTTIQYQGWSRATNPYYASFNNDATGSGASQNYVWGFFDGATSLQDIIDGGHAIFHGQKSGTSGAGSLSVIKSVSNFYTDLPDEIVCLNGTSEVMLRLTYLTDTYIQYIAEDHGTASSDYRFIKFDNTSTGDFSAKNTVYWTTTMSDNPLRWYIENGRALYHGSDPVTSRIGQLEEIKSVVPLANEIDIPDAILGRDINGNLRLIKFTQARADRFDYQSNSSGGNYLFAFDSTTGAWTGGSHAVNVTKEYDDIQGYIAAGRALFYGRTGSNLDQLVGDIDDLSDVDTSTTAPSAGQVLVYDDADSKWKPGAQSNEFVDLTDTPSSLDAGSYLRVNTAGDAIEQIKTAPPDGGIGDNSGIQAASNFAGKLPDQLMDLAVANAVRVFDLYHINTGGIYYVYKNNNGYCKFNNSVGNGGVGVAIHTLGTAPQYTNIQDYIDNGQAVFHGQKSGTSGVGSLNHLKTLVSGSPNGGFYTELPDAIMSENTSGTYNGIFKLHWVKPNATAGGTTWEVIYRAEAFSSGDYFMGYLLDADGTKVVHSGVTHANPTTKNLRWFIENGRAIYNGGYNESNVVSARIAADGTILSSNYDWIQSVNRDSEGKYIVTFKPGHFTSTPALSLGADHAGGVSHVTVEFDNPTTTGCVIYTRKNKSGFEAAVIDANFTIMAQHQDRPVGLAAPQYGIKAWGVFDGTQGTSNNHTITGFTGGNVASIVRISTGVYKVSFINPMPHADYSVSGSANPWGFGGSYIGVRHTYNSDTSNNSTTTTFVMDVRDTSNVNSNSNRISFQVVC